MAGAHRRLRPTLVFAMLRPYFLRPCAGLGASNCALTRRPRSPAPTCFNVCGKQHMLGIRYVIIFIVSSFASNHWIFQGGQRRVFSCSTSGGTLAPFGVGHARIAVFHELIMRAFTPHSVRNYFAFLTNPVLTHCSYQIRIIVWTLAAC